LVTDTQTLPAHVPPELVRTYPIIRGQKTARNPHFLCDEIHRTYPPAFYVQDLLPGHRPGWVFRQYEDVRNIYSDTTNFSTVAGAPFSRLVNDAWRLVPAEVDPPHHTFTRALVNPLFTPGRMARLEDEIRAIAREYILRFRDRGRCEFMADFGFEFPIKVFLKLMGLPEAMTEQFLIWEQLLIHGPNMDEVTKATVAVVEYLDAEMEDRRKSPREDFITYAVQAELRGRKFTAPELTGFCFNLYVGGLDTVTSTMGHHFRHLADHPEHQAALRANPGLIPDAVDELMRAFGAATNTRTCVNQIEIGGVTLKPGDKVLLVPALAGRDPAAYERANEIILDRKPKHVSFGAGAHVCVGIHLAKRELRIALEEFLKEVPEFHIEPGAEILTDMGGVLQIERLPLVWNT
jgi:cytochrome P450